MSFHKKMSNISKMVVSKVILFFLGRGMQTLYKNDSIIKHEIEEWKDGYVIQITTEDKSINWQMQKVEGTLKRVKRKKADLSISFKSIDILFKLTIGRLSVAQAYAEHRFLLKGEIRDAMSLVRVIDRTEGYLFPSFMTKGILKEIPKREKAMIEVYGKLLLHI